MIPEVLYSLGSHRRLSRGLLVCPDTGSMPAAVLGELCLVQKCVPEVSLEERAAGVPLGVQEGEGTERVLWFHVSIREASGVPLKARVEANVHL